MHNQLNSKHTFDNPFFIGTVVNNSDPTQSYRVKVRIPELHPASIPDKDLPWAAKVDASFMGMGSGSELLHSVPVNGSKVLVLAIANDPNSLVYLGCLYTAQNITPRGDKYLQDYGIYTQKGEFIGVERLKNVFHMIWSGDLTLDVEGKIKIGAQAQQPAVLGDDLKQLLQTMITQFNTHTHTGNLGMPTSPPGTPMTFSPILSQKVTVE